MTFLEWLGSSAATTGLLVGLGYLLRDWLLTKLAARIKHKYDEDLARLQSDLSRGEFRYSVVFKETADAIVKTYQKLLVLHNAAQDAANDWTDEASRPERISELNSAADDFNTFFQPNKIYIPKNTRDQIWEYWKALNNHMRRHGMLKTYMRSLVVSIDGLEKRHKEVDALRDKVSELLASLEDEFQRILGIPMDAGVDRNH